MFGGRQQQRLDRLEARIRSQDAVLRALCARVGIDPADLDPVSTLDEEERALLAEGKDIAAIKHHRQRTGSSLLEAKRAVDDAGR